MYIHHGHVKASYIKDVFNISILNRITRQQYLFYIDPRRADVEEMWTFSWFPNTHDVLSDTVTVM